MENRILRTGPNDAGKRLDRVLRVFFPQAGLGAIFAALRKGGIRVNGKKAGRDYRLAEGDEISVRQVPPFSLRETPHSARPSENPRSASPQFHILYQDQNLIAINKAWGDLSHGPDSLDESVKAYLEPLLPPSLAFSPAPLHRLDRNTSGLIFFSKSIEGARTFTAALRAGEIQKTYYALLEGRIAKAETWTDSLTRDTVRRTSRAAQAETASPGKTAWSDVRPLAAITLPASGAASAVSLSLCEITIHTGRTHQIRAQAAAHGHPLAGDRKYGGRLLSGAPHGGAYILHAARVSLPASGLGKPLAVHAPLPEDARLFLEKLFGEKARRHSVCSR
ncbi:MAG: RluA family pseudouridine synthase [Spirochaetales bacterium]|jgi:23S rRNA pseudouridine955/2504/2580 synthase|nr:RluA family pseudouridine synthase [Spirochaetales bacterium]